MAIQPYYYQSDGKIAASFFPQCLFTLGLIGLAAALQAALNQRVPLLVWPFVLVGHGALWWWAGRRLISKAHTRNPSLLLTSLLLISVFDFWFLSALESGMLLLTSRDPGYQTIVQSWNYLIHYFQLAPNQISPEEKLVSLTSLSISLEKVRLVEWLLMLGAVGWLLVKDYRSRVYCNQCHQWATGESSVLAFYLQEAPEFEKLIPAANLSFLDHAEPILTEPFQDYYQINASVCEGCNGLFAVSVDRYIKPSNIDKGKPKRLIHQLLINRAAYQHLLFEKGKYPVPDCSQKIDGRHS